MLAASKKEDDNCQNFMKAIFPKSASTELYFNIVALIGKNGSLFVPITEIKITNQLQLFCLNPTAATKC